MSDKKSKKAMTDRLKWIYKNIHIADTAKSKNEKLAFSFFGKIKKDW